MALHKKITVSTFGVKYPQLKTLIWDTPKLIEELERLGAERGQSLRYCDGGAYQPVNNDSYPYNYTIGCAIIATIEAVATSLTTFEQLNKGDEFFLFSSYQPAVSANYYIKSGPKRGALQNLTGCIMNYRRVRIPSRIKVYKIDV